MNINHIQASLDSKTNATTFYKYQSLGNDFIIIDEPQQIKFSSSIAQKICHRHCGIGADGILYLQKKENPTEFHMLVQNADGSDGQFSGNGLRCLAQYIYKTYGLKIISFTQFKAICSMDESWIYTTMPLNQASIIGPSIIPLDEENAIIGYFVTTHNPHFIIINPPIPKNSSILNQEVITTEQIYIIKKEAPDHNISWVQITDSDIYIRTFERGVGFTNACSSAIFATIELLIHKNIMHPSTKKIITPGGIIHAQLDESLKALTIITSAHYVFTGFIPAYI